VAGVASYAYDWTEPAGKAKRKAATIDTFQEAVVTASESDANIDFDYDTLNPHFSTTTNTTKCTTSGCSTA